MRVEKATIVRTILFVVAVINRFLTSKGIGTSIFMDDALANALADIFLSIMGVIVLWYNNSFTKEAIEADCYLQDLKNGYSEDGEDE